jgi:hypothetical protein
MTNTTKRYDTMQNLMVLREVRSGYCWTKRHKRCKHDKGCHCTCHSQTIERNG